MRRIWRAFWTAMRDEADRQAPKPDRTAKIKVEVDSEAAMDALARLEATVDRLTQKAEYLARLTGRMH